MKCLAVIVLTILSSLAAANGQQMRSQTAPSQSQSNRNSYDPMARGAGTGQPKGIVETTLAGVNPQNKDYGLALADWRKEVFENTVHRIYLWSIFLLCIALSTSLLGNGWLIRDRQRRLTISANIVVQLFNAYIGSRGKALDVIHKYNVLVERFNRLGADRVPVTQQAAIEKDGKGDAQVDFDRARQDKATLQSKSGTDQAVTAPAPATVDAGVSELERIRLQVRDHESTIQRKDAQLQAKDNQITNLRGRLTRAHDNLEGERQQKSGTRSGV